MLAINNLIIFSLLSHDNLVNTSLSSSSDCSNVQRSGISLTLSGGESVWLFMMVSMMLVMVIVMVIMAIAIEGKCVSKTFGCSLSEWDFVVCSVIGSLGGQNVQAQAADPKEVLKLESFSL